MLSLQECDFSDLSEDEIEAIAAGTCPRVFRRSSCLQAARRRPTAYQRTAACHPGR
jgi:hypothetical protein